MSQDNELNSLLEQLDQEAQEVSKLKEVAKPEGPKTQLITQSEVIVDTERSHLEERVIAVLKEFDTVGTEILSTWRDDRNQTQEVITLLLDRVKNDPEVPRVVLESLVQALAVKANTSLTAVKLLDSKTRLITATKSQILIQNNVGASDEELTALLSQPVQSDFD